MKTRQTLFFLASFLWLMSCDGCGPRTQKINPSLVVLPTAVDFGAVKVGAEGAGTLKVSAASRADVVVETVVIEGNDAAFFQTLDSPRIVPSLSEVTWKLTFRPDSYRAFFATLVISSNDVERPVMRIPLVGTGVSSRMVVTPSCDVSRGCQAIVNAEASSINFGKEPLNRLVPLAPTALPQVAIVNEGEVELKVLSLQIEGNDASAFSFAGSVAPPANGLTLGAGEGVNLALRFVPTKPEQLSYRAQLRIQSDDVNNSNVVISLEGELRPNLAPVVCANITRVVPGDGSAPLEFNSPQVWSGLVPAPEAGYDFSTTRDIQPKSEVTFSALSNANDVTSCTNDPEDGRTGLTFQWRWLTLPDGASVPPITANNAPQFTLRPKTGSGFVTGRYAIELTVTDSLGASTTVPIQFSIALKQDLVIQLTWAGLQDVDLDLHLIRPSAAVQPSEAFSGAFVFFSHGLASKTAGDINGYSARVQATQTGFDFDWGDVGTADDPRLNVDDTGSGDLLELISLNDPENDAACSQGTCRYKVMVHYFKDGRSTTGLSACNVTGSTCQDGDACDCSDALMSCVANVAPLGQASTGAGKCFVAPMPLLKVFFKGSPTPAKVIPLAPDSIPLAAPCQMLYLADIVWPARGSTDAPSVEVKGANAQGAIVQPLKARFGQRSVGSLQCSPNSTAGSVDWYLQENAL